MFGIGYQELLSTVVLLVLHLLALPAVTYLLGSLFLQILESARALLAFWLLAIVVVALKYRADREFALVRALLLLRQFVNFPIVERFAVFGRTPALSPNRRTV
jgi:hypothetical protein